MPGTKETLELLDAVGGLAIAYKQAKADGKIDIRDWPAFVGAAMKLPAGLIGINQIPAEFADFDASERETIGNRIAELAAAAGFEVTNLDELSEVVIRFGQHLLGDIGDFVALLKQKDSTK